MAWTRHAAGKVRKVDLNSLCKSEGTAFSHKLCKETFSITCLCVADVVGRVGYGGGWGATKLSRSAQHLPLVFYHFALVYITKLHQEKSCSSAMPVEWFYLAGMLDHVAPVHPFHGATNCVGTGHAVHARCMWDIKFWKVAYLKPVILFWSQYAITSSLPGKGTTTLGNSISVSLVWKPGSRAGLNSQLFLLLQLWSEPVKKRCNSAWSELNWLLPK